MNHIKVHRIEALVLALWFALNLMIGAMTVHQYGVSLDEPNNYRYAKDTLAAYPSFFGILYEPKYDSSYDGHGPAYVAIVNLLVIAVQSVFPDVYVTDVWHYLYFVTFQLMGLCIFWLARRWFSRWTAWAILILFGTQPVLLGHAFMNPKDTPFMFLFTLSILWGFRVADGLAEQEPSVSMAGSVDLLRTLYQQVDPPRKRMFLRNLTLAIAILLALILLSGPIHSLIEQTVASFYTASADSWAGRIFNSLANQSSNVSLDNYVDKTIRLFERAKLGILIASAVFFLGYFVLLIYNTTPPAMLQNAWLGRHKLGSTFRSLATSAWGFLQPRSLRTWFGSFFRALRDPRLILAGIALGLATAVRPIAPVAGFVVVLYLFMKSRSSVWTTTAAYFLVAGIATYVAWPYLWDVPILKYLESLGLVSNFPHYSGRVLFNGQFYGIRDLPYSYLPVLLSIQFTEPLVLSFYAGIVLFARNLLGRPLRTDLVFYILLGFALPLFGLIALNSPLYHNFRQVLFLIPPMFIAAGFAFDVIFQKLSQSWVRAMLILALALPGIYSTAKLYPYQYIYYNSFVGGTAQVHNRFELDYWRTSLREAAVKLNEIAPEGARIIISGSAGLFNRYARPDFFVETVNSATQDLNGSFDYSVQLSRWQRWDIYPNARIEVLIERDGTVLATIRSVRNVSFK